MLESYAVVPVTGLKPSGRRAIAFLVPKEGGGADAQDAFTCLKENRAREVRSRFDYWIDGGKKNEYFHGWPNQSKYKECWVFEWKEKRQHHRLYGFLCHPYRLTKPGFQLCVLVLHATKNEWKTDTVELDRVVALQTDARVIAAIARAFVDKRGSRGQWLN